MSRQIASIDNKALPAGWLKITLGQVVELSKDKIEPKKSKNKKYIGLEHIESNTGRIISIGVSSNVRSTKSTFNSGDILYGRLRPYLNKVCIPEFSGICSTDILVLKPHKFMLTLLLRLYLQMPDFVQSATNKSQGVNLPRIKFSSIENYLVPVPPLNEQKRIIAKLKSIFAKIDAAEVALKTVQILTKQLRQAVLKLAFDGRLVPQDPNDIPAKHLLKNTDEWSDDGALPVGWIKTKMRSCSTIMLGLSPPSSTYNTSKNGLPFFQGKADFGQTYPTVRIWCTKPKRIIEKDTLLLSVRAPVGSLNISTEQSAIGRGLAGIKPFDKMSTKFFFYLLQNKRAELEQSGTGTTFTAIRGKDIHELGIFLPPFNEQKRIVFKIESILDHANTIDTHVTKLLSGLIIMRKALLKQAFEGRLVPQDPRDEPAHMLLEHTGGGKHA